MALDLFTVRARLVYDNITMTPVFQRLGLRLWNYSYVSTVLTFSVDTYSSAGSCGTVYGDGGQVLPSDEVLAATGGAVIGRQPYGQYSPDGGMICDHSFSDGWCPSPYIDPQGWAQCATATMINIPMQRYPTYQPTRTVTDMHYKPGTGQASCTFQAIWSFLTYRQLTGYLLMFGETWSNSQLYCNGHPDASLTRELITAYAQNPPPNAANVVFRPWGNIASPSSTVCETPLNIGAQSGTFRQ